MLHPGDAFVYFLLILLIGLWFWRPWKKKRSSSSTDVPKTGKMVALLTAEGYDIISGKAKIPMTLHIGDRETDTAITADCTVKLNGRTYIVLTEREEGQSLTAKRVKERYLSSCLAFRTDGIVVINADKTQVKHVDVSIKSSLGSSRLKWGLASFLLGAGITFFWLY